MAAQLVTIDDFDGDGYQDLHTPQGLWRNGNERFYALAATAPEQSTTLATGDFNGDGRADLVTKEVITTEHLRIRLSNGDGSFTALPPVLWSREIKSVAVADFNRDNKLDGLCRCWARFTFICVGCRNTASTVGQASRKINTLSL